MSHVFTAVATSVDAVAAPDVTRGGGAAPRRRAAADPGDAPGSRKGRNLKRDARVAISVTDRERRFTMAAVRGHLTRLEEPRGGSRE